MFQKKEGEYIVSEITKEIQEHEGILATERIEAPDISPKSEIDLDKANNIYDKYTEDVFAINNESVQADERIDLENIYEEIYGCDIDDFSFEEFDFADEKLEQTMAYFDEGTWKKLDLYYKRDIIQDFAMNLGKTIGLKRIPRVFFYYGSQEECGAYSKANNTIKINLNNLDNSKMAISTIAHETWHAYQHQCAENPQTRKDVLYAVNFSNYVTPVIVDGNWVLFDEYESQLVEAEANAFGLLFEEKVGRR